MLVVVGKDCVLLSGRGFKSRVAKITFFFPIFLCSSSSPVNSKTGRFDPRFNQTGSRSVHNEIQRFLRSFDRNRKS